MTYNNIILIFSFCVLLQYSSASQADSPFRHFGVYKVPEVGLTVYKPATPEWNIDLNERNGDDVILMSSPEKYFPPTSIEIRLNQRHEITSTELEEAARVIANTLRRKIKSANPQAKDLQPVQYGNIRAVKDDFNITHQDQELSIRHIIGRMPSGHIVTMMVATPKNQIDSIELVVSKIYSNLEEI